MDSSLAIRALMMTRWLLVVLVTLSSRIGLAEIKFDILDNCHGLTIVYESLRSDPTIPATCRAPSNPIERALASHTRLNEAHLCFLYSPPAPFLSNFSCFRSSVETGAVLTCFRSATLSDIQEYKEQFATEFANKVTEYLAAAAACGASNGDSTHAQQTQFAPFLRYVSNFEFGFIAGLGADRPSSSSVVHGYASIDPEVEEASSALEFVYFITDAPKYAPSGERRSVGDWIITIDDAMPADKAFNANAKILANLTSYSIDLHTNRGVSQSEKLAHLERWQRAVANTLEAEGFQLLSDGDLKAYTGMSGKEMLDKSTTLLPFGSRQSAAVKWAPTLLVLLNVERPRCTNAGGVIGAYVMTMEPIPDVASDFGDVSLFLVGLGSCSHSSNSSTRKYFKGLIDETTTDLINSLRLD